MRVDQNFVGGSDGKRQHQPPPPPPHTVIAGARYQPKPQPKRDWASDSHSISAYCNSSVTASAAVATANNTSNDNSMHIGKTEGMPHADGMPPSPKAQKVQDVHPSWRLASHPASKTRWWFP